MSRKHNKKTYNPPPRTPDKQNIPKEFSSYILLNPAFPVEIVYQILSNTTKEPMMMIKGRQEDFADNPSIMFRKVSGKVTLNQTPVKGEPK